MIIVVDLARDGSTVLAPLGRLDFAVVDAVTEVLKELREDLILGHLTDLYLMVHAAVLDTVEVSSTGLAIKVQILLRAIQSNILFDLTILHLVLKKMKVALAQLI